MLRRKDVWRKLNPDFGTKLKKTLNSGRYLDNDEIVLDIRNHIPRTFEVEIYIEHIAGVTIIR